MPNKPRAENPARPVRIEDGLWAKVQAVAAEGEITPSEVVREAVRRFVTTPADTTEDADDPRTADEAMRLGW